MTKKKAVPAKPPKKAAPAKPLRKLAKDESYNSATKKVEKQKPEPMKGHHSWE